MYKFGKASTRRLQTCHPDIQAIMHEALKHSEIDFTIVCGFRGEAEQNKAYEYRGPKGERKSYAKFGESPHNVDPSLAVDLVAYRDGKCQWDNQLLFDELRANIRIANEVLIARGDVEIRIHQLTGNWDRPHWEAYDWKKRKQTIEVYDEIGD